MAKSINNVMQDAVELVQKALGEDMKEYLLVSKGEELVEESDYISVTVGIESKDRSKFDHQKFFLQIDYSNLDDEFYMVFGIDSQAPITRGNIFEWLYYGVACKIEM